MAVPILPKMNNSCCRLKFQAIGFKGQPRVWGISSLNRPHSLNEQTDKQIYGQSIKQPTSKTTDNNSKNCDNHINCPR